MIATESNLNDLMLEYYKNLNSRDAGIRTTGLIQLVSASAMQTNGNTSSEYTFSQPEKTLFFTVLYVENGTISAGTISLETAHVAGYTGTWHALETRTFSGSSGERVRIAQFQNGPILNVRARCTSTLVGGGCDIFFIGA